MVKWIIEDEQLSPVDVRRALDEILASEMVRHSPQLAIFLRFIVEASPEVASKAIRSASKLLGAPKALILR